MFGWATRFGHLLLGKDTTLCNVAVSLWEWVKVLAAKNGRLWSVVPSKTRSCPASFTGGQIYWIYWKTVKRQTAIAVRTGKKWPQLAPPSHGPSPRGVVLDNTSWWFQPIPNACKKLHCGVVPRFSWDGTSTSSCLKAPRENWRLIVALPYTP